MMINGQKFINRLKSEFHFQKVYWGGINKKQKNYQKIVLLYELFDLIEHSMNRKGFFCEGKSLTEQIEEHPAYYEFYQPYKMRQYFSAFKGYFSSLK